MGIFDFWKKTTEKLQQEIKQLEEEVRKISETIRSLEEDRDRTRSSLYSGYGKGQAYLASGRAHRLSGYETRIKVLMRQKLDKEARILSLQGKLADLEKREGI